MNKGTILASCIAAITAATATADTNYFNLSAGPFVQDWSNIGQITTNDDWSGVPSITGYLGDAGDPNVTNVDPQTVVQGFATADVIANQTNPNTLTNGGVAEFEIENPVVALQGSGTADAPNLVIFLNTLGVTSPIQISYLLRDIDGSADNSTQQFALQYRIGSTGDFINIPTGFVPDASTGPSLAIQITPVNTFLPLEVNNQGEVQIRILTTNAAGNDEWVGIDDIRIAAVPEPSAAIALLSGIGVLLGLRRRRTR